MNQIRRKQVTKYKAALESLKNDIDFLKMEEEMAHDNLPEGLQDSERADNMLEAVDHFEDAMGYIEDAILELDEIV